MKHVFFILFVLVLSNVNAKEHQGRPGSKIIGPSVNDASPASRTTAAQERLIGYSYKKLSNHILLDTCYYIYSGNRGSVGNITWNTNIIPTIIYPDSQNISCDSFYYQLTDLEAGHFTYNTSNQAIQITHYDTFGVVSSTPVLDYNDVLTRNASNNIIEDSYYYYRGFFQFVDNKSYDASSHLILDSSYYAAAHEPYEKTIYINDGSGNNIYSLTLKWNTTTVSFDSSSRDYKNYDAYNHLIYDSSQNYVSGSWQNFAKTIYTYPGSGHLFNYAASFTWNGTSWSGYSASSYHFNSANQWDTITLLAPVGTTSTFTVEERDYQIYDSYGNIKYAGGILPGVDTAYDLNTYYYEQYGPGAGVTNINISDFSLNLYPNPASNVVTIETGIDADYSICVYDITGRVVLEGTFIGRSNSANISMLQPGLYIVKVSGNKGVAIEKMLKE